MRFGVDYVSGPTVTALKQHGVKFVCRYLSTPGNPKNLTASEAKRLRAGGLEIVLVFETTAARALEGYDAGAADAKAAAAQAKKVGAPAGTVLYFAVDTDLKDYAPHLADGAARAREKLGPVAHYFDGVRSVLPAGRVGGYGGYWVIRRLFDAALIRHGWQTYAWSGGKWEPRARLRQYLNGVRVAGASVDYNHALSADVGQWPRPPAPVRAPAWVARMLRIRLPFYQWAAWRDHGAPARRRPAGVPKRVPRAWWARMRKHQGH